MAHQTDMFGPEGRATLRCGKVRFMQRGTLYTGFWSCGFNVESGMQRVFSRYLEPTSESSTVLVGSLVLLCFAP